MTTPEVLGVFVGIPLAICGVITVAVYAWERRSSGGRRSDTDATRTEGPSEEQPAEPAAPAVPPVQHLDFPQISGENGPGAARPEAREVER